MEQFADYLGSLASLIGSLTVVGGALLWIYNKFIGAPREKKRVERREKEQQELIETITHENEPLSKAVEQLGTWVEESVVDRQSLHKEFERTAEQVGKHEDRLDEHNVRLTVLETKNGITKIKYKEEHE